MKDAPTRQSSERAHGISAVAQVRALVATRFQMALRPIPGAAVLPAWVGGAVVTLGAALVVGMTLRLGSMAAGAAPRQVAELADLMGGLYLTVAVGILVTGLTSSGGRELYPRDHLVAFPVRPAADHLVALLLTPLNLAWLLQVWVLTFAAASVYGAGPGAGVAIVLAWLFVAVVTLISQALAWVIELVRTFPYGRLALFSVSVIALSALLGYLNEATLVLLFEEGPAAGFATDLRGIADGSLPVGTALRLAGILAVVGTVAMAVGVGLRGLLELRPGREQVRRETRSYAARPVPATPGLLGDVLLAHRLDWVGVLRSPPLRRALVVLLILPPLGASVSRVPTAGFPMLAAVIAAATSLVVAVNAFCLDGPGALWRQTLPDAARSWFIARALLIAEMSVGIVLLTLVGASFTATGRWPLSLVVAAVVAVPVVVGQASARCLRWSVASPHKAVLRTPRDSPAPPGTMAGYSMRLMGPAVLIGILLGAAGRTGWVFAPVLVAVVSLALSGISIRRTYRSFVMDDDARARVALLVAA